MNGKQTNISSTLMISNSTLTGNTDRLLGVIRVQNYRFLVTGGAGFIGSELVRHLGALGASVRVVDNLVNGRRENLVGVLGNKVELTVADVRDRASMSTLMRDVDIVFHLACLGVRHSIHSPIENEEVNATATLGTFGHSPAHESKTVCLHLDIRGVWNGDHGPCFGRASNVAHDNLWRFETRWRGPYSRLLARVPFPDSCVAAIQRVWTALSP